MKSACRWTLIAWLCVMLMPSAMAADSLQSRSDRYRVQWGSMSLGEGRVTLTPLGDDCYRYESLTDPVALVRWTYGAPRETSEFCMVEGQVQPRSFAYRNDKRSKDNFSLTFDWQRRQVRVLRGGKLSERPLEGNAMVYDRFVIREAVRLWTQREAANAGKAEADFTMVDDDRIRTYRFAITARESIDTPAGRFDTIRVERIDHPRKSYRYWLAPSRDFQAVKIEHLKDGEAELRMVLLPN